ncbi:MAG: hypothetical protein HY909_16855 [Deltaproteobacteria bacterium]|nr:hypothetical protein [Deltaproteobacteria bacterium]
MRVVSVILAASLAASQGWSQPVPTPTPTPAGVPTQADRDAARRLALEGVQAFDRADWATVIARFESAEQRFHAPIHLRYLAVAYERSSRLLESARFWERLAQESLAADAPAPFRDAVAEAQRELPRVLARVGRVVVELANAPPDATVELDGQPAPTALQGPTLVEPGAHTVLARASGRPEVRRTVDVAAGATERVSLVFEAAVTAPSGPAVPEGPRTTTVLRPNPLRTVGLVVGGVGVVTVLGGVITGVLAQGAFSDLEQRCPGMRCPTQADLDMRSGVDGLAGLTTALLVSGGVLAAAGVVLFAVSTPRVERVQVTTTGTGLNLRVTF